MCGKLDEKNFTFCILILTIITKAALNCSCPVSVAPPTLAVPQSGPRGQQPLPQWCHSGPISRSPCPCLAQPWAPQTRLSYKTLSWPWPIPGPREDHDTQGWGSLRTLQLPWPWQLSAGITHLGAPEAQGAFGLHVALPGPQGLTTYRLTHHYVCQPQCSVLHFSNSSHQICSSVSPLTPPKSLSNQLYCTPEAFTRKWQRNENKCLLVKWDSPRHMLSLYFLRQCI